MRSRLGPVTEPSTIPRRSAAFSSGVPPETASIGARSRPRSSGAIVNSRTSSPSTSAATVSSWIPISSIPAPWTTKACSTGMCASDRAIVPTRSGSYTPSTCASAPAGLVSGPSTLKIVRIPSSLRGPMTAFIAGWKTGASMNPIPSVSIASSTAGGSASTSAPATSSTSALPDEEDTE